MSGALRGALSPHAVHLRFWRRLFGSSNTVLRGLSVFGSTVAFVVVFAPDAPLSATPRGRGVLTAPPGRAAAGGPEPTERTEK